jgi:hypothetical protein
MVITTISTPKDFRGTKNQEERKRILDEEIRYTTFLQNMQQTADGGFEFRSKDWDEFDNGFEVVIQITREDVESIKEMISKGLI